MPVSIDVKDFLSEVVFGRAEGGVIATADAGSREVRQFPLILAEGYKMKRWARRMWRLRPKGRRTRIAVEAARSVGLACFMPGGRRP